MMYCIIFSFEKIISLIIDWTNYSILTTGACSLGHFSTAPNEFCLPIITTLKSIRFEHMSFQSLSTAGMGVRAKISARKYRAGPRKPIRSVFFPIRSRFFQIWSDPIFKFWNVLPSRSDPITSDHKMSDLIGRIILWCFQVFLYRAGKRNIKYGTSENYTVLGSD